MWRFIERCPIPCGLALGVFRTWAGYRSCADEQYRVAYISTAPLPRDLVQWPAVPTARRQGLTLVIEYLMDTVLPQLQISCEGKLVLLQPLEGLAWTC